MQIRRHARAMPQRVLQLGTASFFVFTHCDAAIRGWRIEKIPKGPRLICEWIFLQVDPKSRHENETQCGTAGTATIKLMPARNHRLRLRLSRRLSVIFHRLDIVIDTMQACINQRRRKNRFGESARRCGYKDSQVQAPAADGENKKRSKD